MTRMAPPSFPSASPPVLSGVALHVRSYGPAAAADRHDFAQLVLPLDGMLELDIAGRGGLADPLHAAAIAPGAWHAQQGRVANRSLIVDIDAADAGAGSWARLFERPFVPLAPAARKLVEFMGIVSAGRAVAASTLSGWTPLLLDALATGTAQPRSRLAALLAQVEASPGEPWTVDSMARAAGMSVSRLHALFRAELDSSPRAWLQGVRLARACEWLACTSQPVAAIALAAGFSDQSALTRAMRHALDTTPAAYRRETRPKPQ
jgi:AraC-like DNA-binding protein